MNFIKLPGDTWPWLFHICSFIGVPWESNWITTSPSTNWWDIWSAYTQVTGGMDEPAGFQTFRILFHSFMCINIQNIFIEHLALFSRHRFRPAFMEFTFYSFGSEYKKNLNSLCNHYWALYVDSPFCLVPHVGFSLSSEACLPWCFWDNFHIPFHLSI